MCTFWLNQIVSARMAATDVAEWVTSAGTIVLGGVKYWYFRLTSFPVISGSGWSTATTL